MLLICVPVTELEALDSETGCQVRINFEPATLWRKGNDLTSSGYEGARTIIDEHLITDGNGVECVSFTAVESDSGPVTLISAYGGEGGLT